ncbi:MAG TPA: 50S ribosomal protein L25/general stress protein Ctc [Methylovirgula sp.]
MAEAKTIAATVRSGIGKGAARSVRREGRIPAVIYGGGEPAEPIALDYRDLNRLIYAGHFLTTIFEIDIEGAKQRVIPRDYQLDPIKDQPLHIDFLRLKTGTTVRVEVPVHFINHEVCPGIKKGGSLNVVRHVIEMRVPAEAIPEAITVDLSNLDIAESLHISSVELPQGCKPTIADRNFTIVTMVPPVVVAETPAAAAAAAPAKGGKAAAKPAAAPAAAAPAAKKK